LYLTNCGSKNFGKKVVYMPNIYTDFSPLS
jgi:hypothetical protein